MSPDDAAQVADQGHWTRGRGRLDFMTPTPHPPGISRWMWLLSLVIAAFGVGVLVISGQSMLDGDLGASGTGPRWVTHPAAFVAGVVMAFAPLGIWLQEKRLSPTPDHDEWDAVVTLHPTGATLPEWPPHGPRDWDEITDAMVAEVPEPARTLIEHYRDHPDDRAEIGSRTSYVRATRLTHPGH